MDALEDLEYDITTSPVKQEEEHWAHDGDDDDDIGTEGAESEPREDDFDPEEGEHSGSSDGSDSNDDETTNAADADGDGLGDHDDSISTHSGQTMSRRASRVGGENGKDDDEGDDDDEDEGEEGLELKEVEGQMGLDRSTSPSQVAGPSHHRSPSLPPAVKRQRLFYPSLTPPPRSLHIDPHMSIPISSPTHSLAATPCLSWVLTGNEDGYVRAWDTWASANGGAAMTANQRSVGGLGEGVTKGGVCRGWWENEGPPLPQEPIDGETLGRQEAPQRSKEPVYSLAIQRDALWGLSGTASGAINLFTVRHALGKIQHRLEGGHTSAISALALSDSEDLCYSAGWDGIVCEWDLNTGRKLRAFPSQNVQLSSLALQPSPTGPDQHASSAYTISYGSWARSDSSTAPRSNGAQQANGASSTANSTAPGTDQAPSEKLFDPLFDEDAEMTSPSKPMTSSSTASSTAAAPPPASSLGASNDADADVMMDDLFGDDATSGLEIPPELLAQVASLDPAQLPAASGTSVTSAALPNGANALPATNGTQPSAIVKPEPSENADLFPAPSVARSLPSLTPATYNAYSPDVLLTSAIDGSVVLWDRRVSNKEMGSRGVGRLEGPERTPKWCMSACFNSSGSQVWAGRRNGFVDVWDVRRPSSSQTSAGNFDTASNLLKSLKNPGDSGAVSSLVAFPDGRHMACAQSDNIRLWTTDTLFDEPIDTSSKSKSSGVPFKIIPGHHGGIISSMVVDPRGKFLITASGNRGWAGFGETTSVVLFHTVEQVMLGRR